ncbi:MAG: helix-turn-helix domain-containing protein [Candidatus Thorarchaeota archaeon]
MNKAYRYELDPNNSQRSSLAQHAGVAHFVRQPVIRGTLVHSLDSRLITG